MTRYVVQESDLAEIDRTKARDYFASISEASSVTEPDADDEYSIIRVLRILHGAQQSLDDDAGENLGETSDE